MLESESFLVEKIDRSRRGWNQISERLFQEQLIRQKGSHAYYRHSDGRVTVLPIHRGEDLGRGLLRTILRDIEITPEDFEQLRKEA